MNIWCSSVERNIGNGSPGQQRADTTEIFMSPAKGAEGARNTDQGSTLTVVHLGIPSLFCCRTTWSSVYGCPLVKLRKLIKWIIPDRSFISDRVDRQLRSESVNSFNLLWTHSCNFHLFHLCSKENKERLAGYTRPFHVWLVTHGQPGRCSPGWWLHFVGDVPVEVFNDELID